MDRQEEGEETGTPQKITSVAIRKKNAGRAGGGLQLKDKVEKGKEVPQKNQKKKNKGKVRIQEK